MYHFNRLYRSIIKEADEDQQAAVAPPGAASMADSNAEGDIDVSQEDPAPDVAAVPEEPVAPEELELAKLAVRALYFNAESKDLHDKKLRYKGRVIPFEKISDEFERHKIVLPVLFFVEKLMDHYEGKASKWTERPEIKGKSIIDKIRAFNAVAKGDEQLDNGKRVYWTRIILNCLLDGTPAENLVISDVNEQNLHEIFNFLKQQYGGDTRGLTPTNIDLRSPGVF